MAEEEPERAKLMFMGRDLTAIPCFRESILYGIGGSVAAGLTFFMFTSNRYRSFQVVSGSFVIISSIYWIRCRYMYFESKFRYNQIHSALENQTFLEGTKIDKEIENANPDIKSV